MKTLVHPWPVHGKGTRIVPVFLPFAGCRTRCIYCAQTLQTGRSLQGIRQVLDEAFSMLRARSKRGLEPCELAFYGGYFVMAFPAALFIRKYSYKAGILLGLTLYGAGALLFIPASITGYYYPFLIH